MVFSSLIFLLAFLPLNLFCYFFVDSIRARNIVLLVFSLVFYAWGEPVFVLILIGMSFFCWLFSLLVEKNKNNKSAKKLYMALAVVVCLGTIGFFKYGGFVTDNLNSLFGTDALSFPKTTMPIGISFYTFQLLTYVTDVYRGEVPAQKKFARVLLYAGLFHQAIGDILTDAQDRYPVHLLSRQQRRQPFFTSHAH